MIKCSRIKTQILTLTSTEPGKDQPNLTRILVESWLEHGHSYLWTPSAVTFNIRWHIMVPGHNLLKPGMVSAVYRPGTFFRPGKLEIAPEGLSLIPHLRGQGMGTWIMMKLVCWATSLPDRTQIDHIRTVFIENDPSNLLRQDLLFEGAGFRFGKALENGTRVSGSMTVTSLIQNYRWVKKVIVSVPHYALLTLPCTENFIPEPESEEPHLFNLIQGMIIGRSFLHLITLVFSLPFIALSHFTEWLISLLDGR